MAKGNSTSLGVDLLLGNTQLVGTPQALAGKSLVDLPDIDIILGDTGKVESLGDSLPGALSHKKGLDTNNRGANVLAEDLLSKLLGSRSLHEEDSGSTIGNLTGVTSVDRTVLSKSRADLAQRLSSDAISDAIILGDGNLLGVTLLVL